MRNFILIVFVLMLADQAVYCQKAVALFNGKDLTGWKINGTEKWYVDKGELISESGPDKQYGYLTTEKKYKNFILSVTFKQEANGNSGVFIRSAVEGTIISGWQVEVAPPGQHTGGIYESYGREWLIKPSAAGEKALRYGAWNTMLIEVRNDEVTTTLNGEKIVNLKDKLIGKGEGVIALQIHSGGGIKVKWKNIKIITL